ncbi:hypothetical protein BD324DRAFT_623489 [Kockovaella imperatae]|uniref:AB hydrolase-1 domain-containing protein n=1 Tax=Kockovaella imperatae TaxID=4999 RepID=A0A1Y1UL60_9TREE|nr:hypothetical protein BD324DRAFT_623489 [Kockovaella imperatae]ORX37835.1 hypothetical protein BD324DRAFT_623489 [Kockovaella imperatae]
MAASSRASSPPASPRQEPTEVTSLLSHNADGHTPTSGVKASPRGSKHDRTVSVSQRSIAGSQRGVYGTIHRPGPTEQAPRVSKAGQRRILTTFPLRLTFFALVLLTFLSLVLSLVLFLNTSLDFSGVLLPYRGSGFADFWYSALGSWIGLGSVIFFSHPPYLFFLTSLITVILHIPLVLLILLNPCLNRAHSPLFLIPFILTAVTLLFSLLSSYLVRRAKWKESQRITRMLTEAAVREREGEESAARVAMGLEKGVWGRFVGFLRGVIGLLAGLAGLVLVVLLVIDSSIRAYDCSVPRPSEASVLVRVHPPKTPWSFQVHLACVDPINSTASSFLVQSKGKKESKLPTVLYESPSGVPGSLALLNHPLPPSDLDAENPGKWIFDLQSQGHVGRVCVWDRPGYGFSDVLSGADLGNVADTLYSALDLSDNIGKNGQFVLVGEGYGSLVSRVFAARHPDLVHSFLHIEAATATTYFSESPNGRSVLSLTAHRVATRLLPSLLTPLSIFRFPSILLRRSTSLSRVLASTYPEPNTAYLSESLQKARLQETFASHTHTSSSFIALLEAGDSYPSKRPAIVISSEDRIKADSNWAEGQRSLAEDVTDVSALVSWEKVKGVGHRVCEGQGRKTCEKALRKLLA